MTPNQTLLATITKVPHHISARSSLKSWSNLEIFGFMDSYM